MKKLIVAFATVLVVPMLALGVSVFAGDSVSAQSLDSGIGAAQGDGAANKIGNGDDIVRTIVNLMLWLIGILSVIMLIFGGIKYATSGGDSNKVTSAKNTIMYAIIGLVVAIFAWAIVNWVVDTIK